MNNKDIYQLNEKILQKSAILDPLFAQMHTTIIGQENMIKALLIGLLADGHILLEGLPGLAKTLAIRTLATVCNVDFNRIQFTPDLLPSDILGTQIFSNKTESFSIKKGPIFAHFVLADEINRAPAKVQSALLQVMQERQVTIASETFHLEAPFLVLATQNPIEQEGTYPLPEAQQDRFLFKVTLDYPSLEEEQKMLAQHLLGQNAPAPQPLLSVEKIKELRECVNEIYLDEKILRYIVQLVDATRHPKNYKMDNYAPLIAYGASPRASIALMKGAQAHAFLKRRGYVIPEDVQAIVKESLRHRIGLSYEAQAEEITADQLIEQIVLHVEVP